MTTLAAFAAGPLSRLVLEAEEGPDPQSISPGLVGFLATFGVVLVVILLFVNMTGRLRRLDHRSRQAEAEREAAAGDDARPDGPVRGEPTAGAADADPGTGAGSEADPDPPAR